MNIYLTRFNKRVNSIDRPSTWDRQFAGMIKGECSIINPVIILDRVQFDANCFADGSVYNYAHIPNVTVASGSDSYDAMAFSNRYYFIDDIVYNNAVVELHLRVDVLATYQSSIKTSSQYVLRSSSDYDDTIPDMYYPAKNVLTAYNSTSLVWSTNMSLMGGIIVIGIVGSSATNYYIFNNPDDFTRFIRYVQSNAYMVSVLTDYGLATYPQYKLTVNPLQYLSSVMWFPFASGNYGTTVSSIPFGAVDVNTTDFSATSTIQRLDDPIYSITKSFDCHDHPQSNTHGRYLNVAPWTRFNLFFPAFGLIELDGSAIYNIHDSSGTVSIVAKCDVDLKTGTGTLYISRRLLSGGGYADVRKLQKLNSQIGVAMQVGQVLQPGYGVASFASNIGGMVGSLFKLDVGGAINSGLSAIGDAVASQIPVSSVVGSTGGTDSLTENYAIFSQLFYHVVDSDRVQHGSPLCQIRQLSTLSGFVLCKDCEIDFGRTQEEQQMIKSYLENGCFV